MPENVMLVHEEVEAAFAAADNQWEVFFGLYKMVYPNWDDIAEVVGWPVCNNYTWMEISLLFQSLDRKHHPEVVAGGLWMNNGFTWWREDDHPDDEEPEDWAVIPAPVILESEVPAEEEEDDPTV